MACEPDSPLDFDQRVKAVSSFSQVAEAADLASANKRISNILKKQDSNISNIVNEAALSEAAEKELYTVIESIEADCVTLFEQGNYQQGLEKLASLRTPVDNFFEHVMVMSENELERQNRLALLKRMQRLFLGVAGVINKDSSSYIKSPEEWIPIKGSLEAIARLSQAGYEVVIITNQSGVGRGLFSADMLAQIHVRMIDYVQQYGGKIQTVLFCPHHPDEGCECRKPLTGLYQELACISQDREWPKKFEGNI